MDSSFGLKTLGVFPMESMLRYQSNLHHVTDRFRLKSRLAKNCISEFCGTAILIILGCGVLLQTSLGDHNDKKHGDFMSISLGWGMAVTFGVFFSCANGPGLINPAITLAFAIVGKVPFAYVPLYTLCQVLGAWFGAITLFGVYFENIYKYADLHDAGKLLVNTTGNAFVTNPWGSTLTCFLDQVFGTALLAAGALTIVDFSGWKMPKYLHPLYLGLLVYTLVGCFALNAGCALNPARDFGPRLAILMLGWGTSAFTFGNYFFWVPIIGPYLGATIGAVLYEVTLGMHMDRDDMNGDGSGQPLMSSPNLNRSNSVYPIDTSIDEMPSKLPR